AETAPTTRPERSLVLAAREPRPPPVTPLPLYCPRDGVTCSSNSASETQSIRISVARGLPSWKGPQVRRRGIETIIALPQHDESQPTHGCRISLSTIGARRLSGRRPDDRPHDLAEPTRTGEGWSARPQSVAPRGAIQGFHRRGVESLWRGAYDRQAADSGAHRPLRHDQQDADPVLGADRRICRKDNARDNRRLCRAEQDDP